MGMMSYPNFGGSLKPVRHPDVALLATLAEDAGVDLRVVAIIRDPVKVMVSTTVNRHFNGFALQVRILRDNQMVMLQQLREIDPRFFVCHDYDGDIKTMCKALGEHFGLDAWDEPWNLCGDMDRLAVEAATRHKDEPQIEPHEHFDAEQLRLIEPLTRAYNETRLLCDASAAARRRRRR